MNPELNLPETKTEKPEFTEKTLFHVGVSGGKDSAAVLLWMIHESGIPKEKIRATFCDIGNDHEWTIKHVALLSEKVHPVETIKPEMGFFELAMKKKRFPSTKARFCTEHLKIYPTIDNVQKMKYEGWNVISVSGVRADESADRAKLQEWDYSGNLFCYQWRPIIKWSVADVVAIHERHGIPLNPLYAIGAQRVGCWPCIMSRKAEIRTIAKMFPARIDEIRTAEMGFEKAFGRYSSFFPATSIPERYRTKDYVCEDGRKMKIATIDDVVKWSFTGKGAKGSYEDEPQAENISCNSGYCE